ncbi:hypothetical protein [Synoicihabitans lomoniglobus]|uniref:Lipocalin-like domain-containing protein n=1 Tax=Synoicihabitans lomoniglobus TaxID=2909285 RepID=A0AAF0CS30_9BACT|nr:hypothetical protein [Opitutaceae bacterium LMO-M01]WED66979.1 hypothetical protein PXH66_08965 [Opitutaceae bacterium LMO-M01]
MSVSARTFLLVALATLSLSSLRAADRSALVGTWAFDAARSTDLSPWRSSQLTISRIGDQLTIARDLTTGRRNHHESMTLDLTAESTTVAVPWWADNRHLGAYTEPDSTKTVRAKFVDGDRVLRLETELTLETQQGPRDVNILSQYEVSPDGRVLTVFDLRSTRPRPVVHVFQRVTE